jgi:MATE family multidrug resistance protein
MVLAAVCNFIGDYALIFGHFGAPALGLVGSGIASACSLLLSFLAMAVVAGWMEWPRVRLLLRGFNEPDWGKLAEILRLGLPISLMQILESGFYLLLHLIVGLFGATVVAAHAIAWNVQTITTLMPTGIGAAATVRTGLAAGAGDRPMLRRTVTCALLATAASTAICGLLIAVLARPIAGLYLQQNAGDPAVIAAAIPFLWVAATYQVFDGVQATATFALRGLKDVHVPLWIMAGSFWLIGLPVCVALAFALHLAALGVWIGLAIALAMAAVMLCVRLFVVVRST